MNIPDTSNTIQEHTESVFLRDADIESKIREALQNGEIEEDCLVETIVDQFSSWAYPDGSQPGREFIKEIVKEKIEEIPTNEDIQYRVEVVATYTGGLRAVRFYYLDDCCLDTEDWTGRLRSSIAYRIE